MTAQIISMQAWRVAHSERPALYSELLRVWMWPVRVWLAWLGGAVMDRILDTILEIRIAIARRLLVWHEQQRRVQMDNFTRLHGRRSQGQVQRMEESRGLTPRA